MKYLYLGFLLYVTYLKLKKIYDIRSVDSSISHYEKFVSKLKSLSEDHDFLQVKKIVWGIILLIVFFIEFAVLGLAFTGYRYVFG